MKKLLSFLFASLVIIACSDENPSSLGNTNPSDTPRETTNNHTLINASKIVYDSLNGHPYFYTYVPRCYYENGNFVLKNDTSYEAYFYNISNDTLYLNELEFYQMKQGKTEIPNRGMIYLGNFTTLQNEWTDPDCYFNKDENYFECDDDGFDKKKKITADSLYDILTIPGNYIYLSRGNQHEIIEKVLHISTRYEDIDGTELFNKYAEMGISFDTTGTSFMDIKIKDKIISIDSFAFEFIDGTLVVSETVSYGKKKCSLSYRSVHPKHLYKYCSEEYKSVLKIDDDNNSVIAYDKGNQDEFYACLEGLLD
jgi:hypothetical protein